MVEQDFKLSHYREASDTFGAPYRGEPMVIAFNPAYLEDGLKAISGDIVYLEMRDGLKPGLFHAGNYTYLLMPVRLQ